MYMHVCIDLNMTDIPTTHYMIYFSSLLLGAEPDGTENHSHFFK